MNPEEFEQYKRERKKIYSEFRNAERISECFYHDKSQCNGAIKQAHSIQRNKRLSIIEGEVKGQNVVYTLSRVEFESGEIKTLKPVGKKEASTFYGFCDYHDTHLFSPIENFPFDESDYHCFLYSYRSFAHSYHIKKQSLKGYESLRNKLVPSSHSMLKDRILGSELAIVDFKKEKTKLDEMIENKKYDELEYFTCVLPEKFPIACSSVIDPEYTYKNVPINDNLFEPHSMIMLTVLPDVHQTIIILACFKDDEKGIILLDELEEIKYPLHFEKAISSLMINNAENTFFAPAFWNALGKAGQKQLCKELLNTATIQPKAFITSKINFFDTKFSASKLGV